MCLLVLAWQAHPQLSTDSGGQSRRAPRAAGGAPGQLGGQEILAGRDLAAGGTWLGLDRQRRFGGRNQFSRVAGRADGRPVARRSYPRLPSRARSRRRAFLRTSSQRRRTIPASTCCSQMHTSSGMPQTARLTLLVSCRRAYTGSAIEYLDTPWPKLTRVRRRFEDLLRDAGEISARELLSMLEDRKPSPASDDAYPADLAARVAPSAVRAVRAEPGLRHALLDCRCCCGRMRRLHVIERRFDRGGRMQRRDCNSSSTPGSGRSERAARLRTIGGFGNARREQQAGRPARL